MSILYLDVDDEITSAASRMRSSTDRRVALVLPAGSRLGTSRINFRLLAREAQLRGRSLGIVTPDPSTRALAASAGLPVFATVFEYEETATDPTTEQQPSPASIPPAEQPSRGRGDGAPVPAAARSTPALPAPAPRIETNGGAGRSDALLAAPVAEGGRGARPTARSAAAGSAPVVTSGGGRRTGPILLIAAAVVALLVLAGGVAAWTFLPSAVVEIAARAEPLGPIPLTIRADPGTSSPDPATLVVPAERPTFELSVSDEFPSTGVRVDETKATGTLRWSNCDPTRAYQIPAGTRARSEGGVAFVTDEDIFLPVAILSGNPPEIECQARDVGATAVEPGTDGNVRAGAITVVPGTFNSVVVRVTNRAATSGGTHTETKIVDQTDVDGALEQLRTQLADSLATGASDPALVPPNGLAFPETATMDEAVPTEDPAGIVGREAEEFTLGLTATGSVTVVDLGLVEALAAGIVAGRVSPDRDLVEGSVEVEIGEAVTSAQSVAFPVTASGRELRRLDAEALRAAIRGRSVDEARGILGAYGDATITTWPDWVSSIPTIDSRLELRVVAAPGSPGASPGGPGASTAPSPTRSPAASRSPAPSPSPSP